MFHCALLILWAIGSDCLLLNGEWMGYIQKKNLSFSAVVPGGVYTDLQKANLIPENLFNFNDVENRWVAHQDVDYVKYFIVDESLLQYQRISIIFHGLDTFASIWVNDKQIGQTENMFLRYSYDIKDHLKIGQNKLKVSFKSPIAMSDKIYKEQSKSYRIPPECVPPQYNGECHVNHIRKMQASYSWDWGPAFPSMGIWKDVEIIPSNIVRVSEVSTFIHDRNSTWIIETVAIFNILNNDLFDAEFKLSLEVNNGQTIQNASIQKLSSQNGQIVGSILLEVLKDSVSLWWPNGYGLQNLYTLNFQVKTFDDTLSRTFKVGFRTVELVEEPLPDGLTFYFRVNGIPIFAKGSNWIPSSVFPELSSEEKTIKHLLVSSKLAHTNMIRVWGGGIYESDRFYELADELGIMIWQDLMFACAMYPTTEQFLQSVKEEVTQNVRKLAHHPSLVIWAGNNENEAALYGNWYGTGTEEIYKKDYMKLYVNVIENEFKNLDRTRLFLVSSPSNGRYAETHGRFEINPQSNYYGDIHYYNYMRNGWNINQYPISRFSSEYGFMSLPSYASLEDVAAKSEDLTKSSEFMKHRQHQPAGDIFVKKLIEHNFNIPETENKNYDFENYIYLSQISQAVSVQIESEHNRQMMSELNSIGLGKTMGALYWQLNDVWQAPSWSSIDFSGRWKMLQYYAIHFFAPVIVSPRLSDSDDLQIYVISDLSHNINDIKVGIKVYKWNSFNPIFTKYMTNITINKRESRVITSFWFDEFLVKNTDCGNLSSAKKNCLMELEIRNNKNQRIAPLNYVYANDFKNLTVRKETFEVSIDALKCREFKIILKSNTLSLFVWLDTGKIKGHFSDNGFHMTKEEKKLIFHSEHPTSSSDIKKQLKIKTLYNIYSNYTLKIFSKKETVPCKLN